MRQDVRKKLIEVARRGETITYGELMKEFGIPRGHPKPGIGIGYVVGEISNYEYSQGRPLLSAIVVRADSRTGICPLGHPGGGFFGLDGIPVHLERSPGVYSNPTLSADEQRFVKEEQERVWDYWRTHNVDDLNVGFEGE